MHWWAVTLEGLPAPFAEVTLIFEIQLEPGADFPLFS